MYNIVAIIISILSLLVMCFYTCFLYGEYIKESKMSEYVYLKVKEKFIGLKKRYDTSLKTGIFQVEYIDKCISNEELIKNKLLNLQYNDIDTTNVILINYYDDIIKLNIDLYIDADHKYYGHIYKYFFEYKINKKDDIIKFLNKIEIIIKTIRNSVLDARKIDNLSGIEKIGIIKDNINKGIKNHGKEIWTDYFQEFIY